MVGFFDPQYKKTLAKTPPHFQALASQLLPQLENRILIFKPASPDIWRAAVVGFLAMNDFSRDETVKVWPPGIQAYVVDHTKIALRHMSEADRESAAAVADQVISDLGLRTT